MAQPLWAQLALQQAASVSLERWGLTGRQLLRVVRRRGVRQLATVELAAVRVQQRLGAVLVEQATAAAILVEVAVAEQMAAAAAAPEQVAAVLEPVAAVLEPVAAVTVAAALLPVAVVRAGRAAGAAARRP